MRAYIVVDLGFGDSGKGLLTDFLVRQKRAGVVVRYNGGAQAGHNVVTSDGRHHTFSQFGAGSFQPGVKTYLSRHVVVHPTALLVEGDVLASKGVDAPFSRLRISEQALVITPFHQAANQLREMLRGDGRHGSCGVGVGETMEDALTDPALTIVAQELHDISTLRRKLTRIRDYKRQQLVAWMKTASTQSLPSDMWQVFDSDTVMEAWISATRRVAELGLIASDALLQRWLGETDCAVFEGAQGVLLDAEAGFHPHTTWSRCSGENATTLLGDLYPSAQQFQVGVLRACSVRHGPGPLPTQTNSLAGMITEHNHYNDWQGNVRYGWFDAVLSRYALDIAGAVNTLLITHMDVLPRLATWKYCVGYKRSTGRFNALSSSNMQDGVLTKLSLLPGMSLDFRERVTHELLEVEPVLDDCEPVMEKVVQKIAALTGKSVGLVSTGPTAEHVSLLEELPA